MGQPPFNYKYDRFGNRWQQNLLAGMGPAPQYSFNNKNRLTPVNCASSTSFCYDSAGNLTNDTFHQYTYDAEGRILAVDAGGSNPTSYVYDAMGHRVQRTKGGVVSYFGYDLAGHSIVEYQTSAAVRSESYAGPRHLVTYTNGLTYFDFQDVVGTERVHMTQNGASFENTYSLPFGDGQVTSGASGLTGPMHFTGKERDAESGLDNFGARYNASTMGRFMTPDPIGIMKQKLRDPQQWNMYAYTRNNPLRFMDPTGMYNTDCKSKDIKGCSKDIQNLDANVKKDLQSKDPAVRAAAAAYGSFNDGNKVNVRFDSNAKAPGEMKQDRDANGKRLDSATVTFQSMTKDSAGRGLVAHEGSHVEDFQAFLAGGPRPSAYAGELKAFQTQAGVLLDEPKGANWRVGSSDSHMFIQRPDSKDNIDNNAWAFPTIIDWVYRLTPDNPGTIDWGNP